MAGKGRYNAMVAQLDQLGGIEWIASQVEDGVTLIGLSEDLTRRSGQPISRYMLNNWIRERGGLETISDARARGAESLVDRAAELVHSTEADRDQIALAKLRAEEYHKRAGWYDKRFGTEKQAQVVINVQSMHIEALRARGPAYAEIVTQSANPLPVKELGEG